MPLPQFDEAGLMIHAESFSASSPRRAAWQAAQEGHLVASEGEGEGFWKVLPHQELLVPGTELRLPPEHPLPVAERPDEPQLRGDDRGVGDVVHQLRPVAEARIVNVGADLRPPQEVVRPRLLVKGDPLPPLFLERTRNEVPLVPPAHVEQP
eukprot:CAMPEP_0174923064 /NCGR_PEP_ID=MMETSP1355-20121228/6330_2 /TAXON_ID=464990 /ORGANISM="Hemiselmis tepida, Strain CCMP443" /LENGTH=151 /DNA_ID=CAMNT_0016168717 /DNA_START=23 /DNA_END=474 /DNA_ORIENTATION=-